MKKQAFLLPTLYLMVALCYSQTTRTVTIECDGDQIRVSGDSIAKNNDRIVFNMNNLAGCCAVQNLSALVTREGLGPQQLAWASNPNPNFTMTDKDATLEITCGNLRAKTVIKVDSGTGAGNESGNRQTATAPAPEPISWGNTLQDAIQMGRLWKQYETGGDAAAARNLKQLLDTLQIVPADSSIVYLTKYTVILALKSPQSDNKKNEAPTALTETPATPAAALSGIFSPTLVIDALAKFAAKRFKQELTIAYLDRFRDSLLSPRFLELRTLFPRTFHTLASANVFDYTHYFQSLHENAQTDLYNLPENTANLVRLKDTLIDPQAYPVILAALDLPRMLETRMPASAAVEFLAYRDYIYLDSSRQTVFGNTARLLGIFSKHLHSWGADTTATGWANEQYLAKLVADEDVFNFWMALVLKNEATDLGTIYFHRASAYSILNTSLPALNAQVRETVARFAEVQGAARQLVDVSKADSLVKRDLFFQYTRATFGLLIAQVNLARSVNPNDSAHRAWCDKTVHLLKAGQDLAAFAHSKRFGDGISVALEIFKLLYHELAPAPTTTTISAASAMTLEEAKYMRMLACKAKCMAKKAYRKAKGTGLEPIAKATLDKAEALLKTERTSVKNIRCKKSTDQINKLIAQAQKANRLDTVAEASRRTDLLSRVDKYGNLLVSLANAQTSDQLLDILEKAAAPVQSYRKKREPGNFSVGINLYPGLAYGLEYQLDSLGAEAGKNGDFIAFTTPVGVSLDWGLGKAGSLSAFVSIIDIGAVTAFRLADTVSILPELTWKNVFAPGLHIMWGIPKSPLTLGIGAQYGPAIRKVDIDNNQNIIEAGHFRVGATLTVDVPLFYLHSGARNKKINYRNTIPDL